MPEKTVFIGFLCTCGWVYRQLHSMLFPRRVMRMQLAKWLGSVGLVLAAQACVVHDTAPVNGGLGCGYCAKNYGPARSGPSGSARGSYQRPGGDGRPLAPPRALH